VLELRVEPASGLEEELGRSELSELVEGDARVVEEDGLARLLLEDRDRGCADGVEDASVVAFGRVVRGVESTLDQRRSDSCAAAGWRACGEDLAVVRRRAMNGRTSSEETERPGDRSPPRFLKLLARTH
jgi:hypothetical protein